MAIRSKFKLSIFTLGMLSIFFVLIEFVSYLSLSSEEKKLSAPEVLTLNQNQYVADYSLKTGCLWVESVIGHPMLGFVHRQHGFSSKTCNDSEVNNIGVQAARNLPLKKQNDEFSIMILGGSVAHQMYNYTKDENHLYLEEYLNQKYFSPNGKKFKIYLGAAGAWAMPNQVSMLLMYGERIDAAISLEGYNEILPIQSGERLERIPPDIQIIANSSYKSFIHSYLHGLVKYQNFLVHSHLNKSYFFVLFYKGMSGFFQKVIVSENQIQEFTKGNTENLKLKDSEAQTWSLQSLERYITKLHQIGKLDNILIAEFLQPSRLFGKTLTEQEKKYPEEASKNAYKEVDQLYRRLQEKKYAIASLTDVFNKESGEIYADHIHYKKDSQGISRGNELVIHAISQHLEKMWHLKKRP